MSCFCPVCKNTINEDSVKCSVCNFTGLHREFITKEDAQEWFDTTVLPYRKQWETKKTDLKDFEIEGTFLKKYKGTADKVTIPQIVTSIEVYAFSSCDNLKTVTIQNGVTRIEAFAFSNCRNLTTVTIPDSVRYVSSSAFWGCENLKSLTVDSDNKYFYSTDGMLYRRKRKNKRIFVKCPSGKKETTITIPAGVTGIADSAFCANHNLTTVMIPDSVVSIGGSAFSLCQNLTIVMIPDSVVSIGVDSFKYCNKLTIHCQKNSYAHKYATENNIPVQFIG